MSAGSTDRDSALGDGSSCDARTLDALELA